VSVSLPPRQPKDTYLQVPEVPEPSDFGLAELLAPLALQDLDANSDSAISEAEFVAAAESVVREAAARAWKSLDSNGNQWLDLEELATVVRKSWTGGEGKKKKRKFSADRQLRVFLWILAKRFSAIDLARSARVSVSSLEEQVAEALRSVVFLDERRSLFDTIAGGREVGDEDGSLGFALWDSWRKRRAAASEKKKAKESRSKAPNEL
ncbi:unnamed protein product, partial [Polarella glacialis]